MCMTINTTGNRMTIGGRCGNDRCDFEIVRIVKTKSSLLSTGRMTRHRGLTTCIV